MKISDEEKHAYNIAAETAKILTALVGSTRAAGIFNEFYWSMPYEREADHSVEVLAVPINNLADECTAILTTMAIANQIEVARD